MKITYTNIETAFICTFGAIILAAKLAKLVGLIDYKLEITVSGIAGTAFMVYVFVAMYLGKGLQS